METLQKTEKTYKEIFKLLEKYKEVHNFNIQDLQSQSEVHLYGLRLKEEYCLNVNPSLVRSTKFNEFHNYIRIYSVGEKFNNSISWSDDGRQPDNELLVNICFPTGAYIFGEDYPTDLFQKFFLELVSYKPKYSDTNNKSLYFSMDNAKDVFNKFPEIMKKYQELNREDVKLRKIARMKKELEKLENN